MKLPQFLLLPLIGLVFLAPVARAADQVLISEFLAENVTGLTDEDGDTSDWIELRNVGSNAVNLAGWRLTDDPDDFTKWVFPGTNLPPAGHLVVFASGKNRRQAGAPLHTSFSLDGAGEYLALIQSNGLIVASEFSPAFPPQYRDVSYGLNRTNLALQHYFATPTPGSLNGTNYFAKVAETRFSHDRGFYETNFALTITCATPGVTIRYTLNGTAPSPTNGTIYAGPLTVTNTTTLRALAYKTGFAASDVDTHTYLFLRDVLRQSPGGAAPPGWPATWGANAVNYGMDPEIVTNAPWNATLTNDLRSIPTLSVVMKLDDLFNATTGIYANPGQDGILWERPVSVERLEPGAGKDRQVHFNGGIRIRGGFSRSTGDPKHSFRFFLRPEYGQGELDFPLFGPNAAGRLQKFDLRSHQDDSWHFTGGSGEFMRDAFSRDSLLACGRVQTHGSYHHLYLNGQYWGLYTTEERPEANFCASYFGGDNADWDVVKVEAGPYTTVVTDGTMDAFFRLWQAATNGFASEAAYQRVQGRNPDGTPNPAYENLVEVPHLIDYMLCIFYAGNLDAPASVYTGNNNWFGARHRDNLHGGFRFFLHDSENSLYGVNDDRTGPTTSGNPFAGSGFSRANPEYVFHQLTANAEFRVQLGDQIQKHFFNHGAFTVEAVTNRYQARRNEISQAVVAESARWGDAQREPPFTWNDWKDASDNLLENYFPFRTSIVLNQLRNRGFYPGLAAPGFSHYGGAVPAGYPLALTRPGPGGILYFTTDGSDPRQRGGNIAPTAQAYATPISIQTGTQVKARIKDGANWSALVEATFFPTTDYSHLALTEIMFNPPGEGVVPGDEFEFLELQNSGNTPIDLSGLAFAEGIGFSFSNGTVLSPGQFLVLARNPQQLQIRYPGVAVGGTYSGRLDNGGERLRITNAFGGSILSVAYDDLAPWPVTPDGLGFALVNRAPASFAAPDDPLHWRASANLLGSPGAVDPEPTFGPVLINELFTHTDPPQTDSIELFNPAPDAVEIGGWFLSDDPAQPRKYRIADGTTIPGHGYLVFSEAQFNATPGTNGSFSLSSEGEQVYLFSGDAQTNLTGYSQGVLFGAAANGIAFGRYLNSQGEEYWPAQLSLSLGSANPGPRVGPVVISEIHYHPALGADAFVELQNLSAAPVPLFDPAFPTNTWRLNGVDFSFPTNTQLAAGGLLLLTATDPALFRTRHSVPPEVGVYGPFPGSLQNNGENLQLQRPDPPNTNGVVPYITVDEVRYNDRLPWPVGADGDGPSLQRLQAGGFGSEPTNWFASGSTPGRSNLFNAAPFIHIATPSPGDAFSPPAAINLTAVAGDSDGIVQRVEFYANGLWLGSVSNSPYSLSWSNAPAGTHFLTAKAFDDDFAVTTSEAVPIAVSYPAPATLVPRGAVWKYLDTGIYPGTNWINPGFADETWPIGPAPLGYGDGDEMTVLGFGNNSSAKYITSWFRHSFAVTNAQRLLNLGLSVLRDDGAVVYLNGVEIFRSNMPGGPIHSNTLASANVGGADESSTFYGTNLPPSLLREGPNVLAVEIHQAAVTSADISFDLELTGQIVPPTPGATILSPADQAVYAAPARITLIAQAESAIGSISLIEFFADSNKIGQSTAGSPASLLWTNVPIGQYQLTAVARADSGIVRTSAPVTISVVANVPPTVAWLTPTNGQLVALGAVVPLTVSAQTAFGQVTRVAFLLNGSQVAESTNAPFTSLWTPSSLGTQTWTALAFNDGGLAATSAPVHLSVVSNLAPVVALSQPVWGTVWNVGPSVSTNFLLLAHAVDLDGTVSKVEFYADHLKLGESSESPYVQGWTTPSSGLHQLYAVATDSSAARGTSAAVSVVITRLTPTNVTLIRTGSLWRYLDTGTDPGTNWAQPGFIDTGWSNGPAQLGYGDGDEATVVRFGPNSANKFITTWFRQSFVVSNASAFADLTFRAVRDDGIVAYLNGVELFRDIMPGGTVTAQTLATTTVGAPDESAFFTYGFPASGLRDGTNILAVEIHQGAVDSSDLSFDLELRGSLLPIPDSDGDLLPDAWELLFGLNPNQDDASGDADGDGLSNRDEFWSGTNPSDQSSVLRLVTHPTGPPEFLALSNRSYSVLWRTNLSLPPWQKLFDVPIAPTNRPVRLPSPEPPPSAARFYRVVTPLWP